MNSRIQANHVPPPSPRRLGSILSLIAVALVALFGRVAYLQTVQAAEAAPRAHRQHSATEPLHARRGSIFDRNGLMLAGTMQLTTVYADPKFMHEQFQLKGRSLHDMDTALEQVARIIHRDPDEVALAVGRNTAKRYVPLARGVKEETAQRLRELKIPGLGFEAEPARVYPMGQTAAHLLGAVGREDRGLEGLERIQNALLAGSDGRKGTIRDKRRRAILAAAETYQLPEHGEHLLLTIDSNLQLIVEQELEKTIRDARASGGCVVVMDPNTGDVLALANYPSYFPQYLADSSADARRNRALTDPFEPGSILKPFLMAGLLERGVTDLGEALDMGDSRYYRPYARRNIIDEHYYGNRVAVWDVMVKSSNIGMVKLGERVEGPVLTDILSGFGFGQRSGLGLGGEDRGQLPRRYGWGDRESLMQGYALLVTPMQLARAMCVIANDGRLVTPRIVAGTMGTDGRVNLALEANLDPQVLEPETAWKMRRVLADVPVRGTARRAKLDRWNIFGKTGTAHRTIKGSYNQEHYVSSFIGGAPFESPRLVISVSIYDADKSTGDTPGKGHHGGIVAAPTAARILNRALDYLDVPDSPELPEPPDHIAELLHNYRPTRR